jgi:hypothetical protein
VVEIAFIPDKKGEPAFLAHNFEIFMQVSNKRENIQVPMSRPGHCCFIVAQDGTRQGARGGKSTMHIFTVRGTQARY